MTDTLHIQDKSIAVPGELLAEGLGFLPSRGTYREGDKIYAQRLGLITIEGKVIKLVPVSGVYNPRIGDRIIAKVKDIMFSGWRLHIRGPQSAVLSLKDATSEFVPKGADLTKYFSIHDWLVCKINKVTSQKIVEVTVRGPGLHKLRSGRIIEVNTHKVPRIIGKEGSMITLVKNALGCNVTVGQNGWVWIQGTPEQEILAEKAIKKIEQEAHLPGLTDRIKTYLEKLVKESGYELPPAREPRRGKE
jgi:exosome complex component RRP4